MVAPMILYSIKDTETGQFWMNSRGRVAWKRKVDAINSWNASGDWPRLSKQDRWQLVPVTIGEREVK